MIYSPLSKRESNRKPVVVKTIWCWTRLSWAHTTEQDEPKPGLDRLPEGIWLGPSLMDPGSA
eukprot:14326234-Ditylum_brightwellii.AAC.1